MIGGRPTGPQVQKLMGLELKEGQELSKEELGKLINELPSSARWRTVVNAWRKQLLTERGQLLLPLYGVGYQVASADQQLHAAVRCVRRGVRAIARGTNIAQVLHAERLTATQLNQQSMLVELGQQTIADAKKHAKQMASLLSPHRNMSCSAPPPPASASAQSADHPLPLFKK